MNKQSSIDTSEEKFERQFKEATKRGAEHLASLPKADSARYDKKSKRLVLEMKNGTAFLIPVNLIQGLQTADEKALSDFDLMLDGTQIHWHTLDVQFYVKSLLEGVFGTGKWTNALREHLANAGRKGGAARSEAKRRSSAENGTKGGRPRKTQVA